MEFGIKNITLTMLLGVTALGSQEVALPAAVYGVMMYIPGLILFAIARRGYVPTPCSVTAAELCARPGCSERSPGSPVSSERGYRRYTVRRRRVRAATCGSDRYTRRPARDPFRAWTDRA